MPIPIREKILNHEFPFINNEALRKSRGYAEFPENKELVKVIKLDGENATVSWPKKDWEFKINIEFLSIPEDCFEDPDEEDEEEDDE